MSEIPLDTSTCWDTMLMKFGLIVMLELLDPLVTTNDSLFAV